LEEENKEIKKNYTWILFALVSLITLILSIVFIGSNIVLIPIVVSLMSSITGIIKYSKDSATAKDIFGLLIIFTMLFIAFAIICLFVFKITSTACIVFNTCTSID